MDSNNLLFVGGRKKLLQTAISMLDSTEMKVSTSVCGEHIPSLVAENHAAIVLFFDYKNTSQEKACIGAIQSRFYGQALQVLAVVSGQRHLAATITAGVNDYLLDSSMEQELLFRIKLAQDRFQSRTIAHEELQFFRGAAKKEEELTARILDQHMVLKEAFENIEAMNQELETTNRKLERVARYDILSGLLNRVSLFTAFDTEIARTTRSESPLSGIMMDIDNFKSINDMLGHLYGDRVIAEVGKRLRQALRRYDLAGRYGGEEFFTILPDTNLSQAYVIAERFRKNLQNEPVVNDGNVVDITASFGIAQYRQGETREMWIARADAYMYHAKQTGRNKVVTE